MAKITYVDKVTMNENPDIPAINKCQAADMNEIKNVVNSNDDELQAINKYNLSYSTNEQSTGNTWIDGKTIYSKTILKSVTSLSNSTTVAVNISNIDAVVSLTVNYDTSNALVTMPFIANNASQPGLSARYVKTSNSIMFFGLATYGDAGTLRVTLEYTKTA